MRAFIVVLCLFVVTACYRESPTAPAPVDQKLTLAPGQTAAVPGTSLQLTFVSVTGDSRCPADANCITGGSATVRVDVAGAAKPTADLVRDGGLSRLARIHNDRAATQAPYPFSSIRSIRPTPRDLPRHTRGRRRTRLPLRCVQLRYDAGARCELQNRQVRVCAHGRRVLFAICRRHIARSRLRPHRRARRAAQTQQREASSAPDRRPDESKGRQTW